MLRGPTIEPPAGPRRHWRTLLDALEATAAAAPKRGLTVIDERGLQECRTWAQLLEGSLRMGAALRKRGLDRGDRVLVVLPTGFDFVTSFFGALSIGAVPVPIAAPRAEVTDSSDRAEYFVRVAERLDARAALFGAETPTAARPPVFGSLRHVLDAAALLESVPIGAAPEPLTHPPELAYLQTTSGATGSARAVGLGHAGILANLHAIGHAIDVRPDDVGISWLPLYNIMGLVGVVCFTIYWGLDVVLLDPERFMKRPEEWLWAFHRHGGTLGVAPSFAYHHCVRRVQRSNLEGLDLSSWRVAMNGGEPVRAEHMRAFSRRFGPYGFGDHSFLPVYGLAEATLAVTFGDLDAPARVDLVSRRALETRALAEPVEQEQADAATIALHDRAHFTSVGRPLAGVELLIVDDGGEELEERRVGEVAVRGPTLMLGYADEVVRRAEPLNTRLRDGWLLTGDLGYVAEGELFVVGRACDRIIGPADRILLPEDIEFAVNAVDGVRSGSAAVFAVGVEQPGDRDRIVVAFEAQSGAETEELAATVRHTLARHFRLEPDELLCLSPRSVPKSSSGKVRRHLARRLYLSGILDRRDRARGFDRVRRLVQRTRHEALKLGQGLLDRIFDGRRES